MPVNCTSGLVNEDYEVFTTGTSRAYSRAANIGTRGPGERVNGIVVA